MVIRIKQEVVTEIEFDPEHHVGKSVAGMIDGWMNPDQDVEKKETLLRKSARERMRDFIPYTFPEYKQDLFHLMVCDAIDRVVFKDHKRPITHLMLNAPPQHGKNLAHSTPVFTPDGWRLHGDLRPGDYVYGRLGQPVMVQAIGLETSERLEVKFSDGAIVRCHPNHEWLVRDRRGHRPVEKIVETKNLIGLRLGSEGRGGRWRWQVDWNIEIEGIHQELPVHPYMLGAWLGDGTATSPTITTGIEDEEALIDRLLECDYKRSSRTANMHYGGRSIQHYFGYIGLAEHLRDIGVFGKGNKHIPDLYLTASRDQRMNLLAGLMDTDGYVYHENGRATFSTCEPRLAKGVADLVRSLGWRATQSIAPAHLSTSGIQGKRDCIQVTFNPTEAWPAAIERKRPRKLNPAQRRRAIVDVRPCDPEPGRCIQVEGGIYLVGPTMIPTHNSEIVSTRLPAFWLAHNPDLPVALVSYAQDLANRNSRQARAVFESQQYKDLFGAAGILKDPENWRVRDWHVWGRRGYAFAAGVGGPITGRGFGCCIIDDPIENWAAAQSETIRESVWDWWKGTMLTRMWEGHRMIFMMTRWHEDDLQARILQQEGRRDQCMDCQYNFEDEYNPELCPECGGKRGKWTVLSFPALCETQAERDQEAKNEGLREGQPDILGRDHLEALAPMMFSATFLQEQKRNVGQFVWGAEYQQHPTPPLGDFFKVGKIRVKNLDEYPLQSFGGRLVDDRPVQLNGRVVRFWDLAASRKKVGTDPDWTSGTLIGIDNDGFTWVLDEVRIRVGPDEVLEMMRHTAEIDGRGVKIYAEQEGGAAGKSHMATLNRYLAGYIFEGIPATGDKETRAYWFAGQVNNGSVRLLKAEWNKLWLAEHRVFPHGKHDDQVDSASGGFNVLTSAKRWRGGDKFLHLGQ